MKNSSVRKPALGNTSADSRNTADMSVGDIMRQAKKDLLFKRISLAMIGVLFVALIIYIIVNGTAADLIDRFFSLMD